MSLVITPSNPSNNVDYGTQTSATGSETNTEDSDLSYGLYRNGTSVSNPNIKNKTKAKMKVRTAGGEILEITFDLIDGKVSNIWLKGSANFIAKGEYYV